MPDAPHAAEGPPFILIYDGLCRTCTRLANALRAWDTQRILEIVPSQAAGVMARFPWIPERAFADAIQLVGPHGETWQGAAAIEELLDILPRGRLISWIFRIPFVRVLADKFYRWFARNRHHLGCGAHCSARPSDVKSAD